MSFNENGFYPAPLSIPKEITDYINLLRNMADMVSGAYALPLTAFGGIKITTSAYLPTERREQFHFPRSKKVRIRKKWRKDQRNWHTVDARGDIYFLGARKDTIAIHPDGYEALKKTVGVIKNCELK